MLVTVLHSSQHLSKQMPCLFFTQALPASQVRVHVAVVSRQKDVRTVLADHHVLQATDVGMVTNLGVGSQPLLVTTQWKYL